MTEYRMRYAKRFQKSGFDGETLKASFSKNAPAKIEYIVTVVYIEEVGCHETNLFPRQVMMPSEPLRPAYW
jgi:hypothetical protein